MDKVTLNRNLVVDFRGNSQTISFPTVGQFIDIETMKVSLSKGEYGNMIRSGTNANFDALTLIDVISYFKILCPKIIEKIDGVDRLEDLDAIDFLELKKVYTDKLLPWISSWYSIFSGKDENKE